MSPMSEPRILPNQMEAEHSVLGGILLRGQEALQEVQEILRPDDFYKPANEAIYKAMVAVHERGEPIDLVTLEAQLRSRDELRLVGGIEGLSNLASRYATTFNIRAHADLVKQASQLRALVLTSREIAEEGMQAPEDVRAFMDDSARKILEVSEKGQRAGYKASKDLIMEVFKAIQKRAEAGDKVTGVPSSFDVLDDMTAGLQPGDLVIIAARPSMGKTAFALNIAQNACLPQAKHMHLDPDKRPRRYPVLFFSLEMGAEQLVERVLCAEARVDYSALRRGDIRADHDYRKLIAAADRIAAAHLFIDDQPAPTILEMAGAARRWKKDKDIFPTGEELGLIVIDYLQLARGASAKPESRAQEVSEISRGLKGLAKELKVPIIALAQLNRTVEQRNPPKPMLSDLRESGAIEQDADVIMFIYREEYYLEKKGAPEEELERSRNKAEIIIGKQRNGPTGVVHLNCIKHHTRFENPAPQDHYPD